VRNGVLVRQRGSFLGEKKHIMATHDEKNELETLNDTESDENASGKKALALEIKAHDDNSNLPTSNQGSLSRVIG
jgi:hypothetical protein